MEVKDPTGPFLVAWFMCLGISKGVVWFMPWHGGMVLGGMVLDLWGSLSLSLVLQGSPSKSTQPQSARTSWYSSRFFTSKRKLPGWLCRTCMRLDECTCRGGGRTGHRSGSSRTLLPGPIRPSLRVKTGLEPNLVHAVSVPGL